MNKKQLSQAIQNNQLAKTRNAEYRLIPKDKESGQIEGRLQLYHTTIVMWRESKDALELYINTGGYVTQTTMSYINLLLRAKKFPFAVQKRKNRWILYTTNSEGYYPTKGELMNSDSISLVIRAK